MLRSRRLVVAGTLALAVVLGLSFLVGHFAARSKTGFFDWELASIFGTALGTTLLAIATGALAYTTSRDVSATQEIAELTRADQAARERPAVVVEILAWSSVPDFGGREFARGVLTLKLRNVGLGPALRVAVDAVYEPEPDAVTLKPFGILPALMSGEQRTLNWSVRWPEDAPFPSESGFRVYGTYRDRSWANCYEITVDETDPRRAP